MFKTFSDILILFFILFILFINYFLTLHTNTVNTNFSALFTEFAIVIEAVEALIVGELGWIFTATDSKVYLIVSRSSTVENSYAWVESAVDTIGSCDGPAGVLK